MPNRTVSLLKDDNWTSLLSEICRHT